MKTKILKLLKDSSGYVSGQDICNCLGVSRTAVWKVMNQLKEEGYEIEAVPNRGYRIISSPDIVTADEIKSLLNTRRIAGDIRYYEETSSTNTVAKQLAETSDADGLLVIAEQQTAGKGRRGKGWVSPKGSGIWMSLVLKPAINPISASMLTLVAALAAARAIRQTTGLESFIKWPNDLVLNGKKICGILTEMSSEPDYINHVVIGMGINANIESFPEEIQDTATSLYLESGQKVKRSQLTAAVMSCFEEYYERFLEQQSLEPFLNEYNQWLINCGREVRIIEAGCEYTGTAEGINKEGHLVILLSDGTKKEVISGEVSVRGLYGYV